MNSNNYPLVSIIMNCHNGEKYLNKSLKSIFSQNYNNWELIFWDNNSKDKSKQILSSYKDKRIKYFRSNKDLKLYHARKLAIQKAKGKYISFLDVDDYWVTNKLKKQVSFLKKNKFYKIIYSNYFIFDEKKNKKTTAYNNNDLLISPTTQDLINKYTVGLITIMLDKKVFEKIKFNINYNIIGDFDFIIRASMKFKIGCIRTPLAIYRIHDFNYSKNLNLHLEEFKHWFVNQKKKVDNQLISLFPIKKEMIKLRVKKLISLLGV